MRRHFSRSCFLTYHVKQNITTREDTCMTRIETGGGRTMSCSMNDTAVLAKIAAMAQKTTASFFSPSSSSSSVCAPCCCCCSSSLCCRAGSGLMVCDSHMFFLRSEKIKKGDEKRRPSTLQCRAARVASAGLAALREPAFPSGANAGGRPGNSLRYAPVRSCPSRADRQRVPQPLPGLRCAIASSHRAIHATKPAPAASQSMLNRNDPFPHVHSCQTPHIYINAYV